MHFTGLRLCNYSVYCTSDSHHLLNDTHQLRHDVGWCRTIFTRHINLHEIRSADETKWNTKQAGHNAVSAITSLVNISRVEWWIHCVRTEHHRSTLMFLSTVQTTWTTVENGLEENFTPQFIVSYSITLDITFYPGQADFQPKPGSPWASRISSV